MDIMLALNCVGFMACVYSMLLSLHGPTTKWYGLPSAVLAGLNLHIILIALT